MNKRERIKNRSQLDEAFNSLYRQQNKHVKRWVDYDLDRIDSYIPHLQKVHDILITLGAESVSIKELYDFINSGGSMGIIRHLFDPMVTASITNFHIAPCLCLSYCNKAPFYVVTFDELCRVARNLPDGSYHGYYEIAHGIVRRMDYVEQAILNYHLE